MKLQNSHKIEITKQIFYIEITRNLSPNISKKKIQFEISKNIYLFGYHQIEPFFFSVPDDSLRNSPIKMFRHRKHISRKSHGNPSRAHRREKPANLRQTVPNHLLNQLQRVAKFRIPKICFKKRHKHPPRCRETFTNALSPS